MTEGPSMQPSAVIVMAYGGPDCLDAVGPFMRELTGREPAGEMLERIQARYSAIGGKSPLPEIAARFADSLAGQLATDGVDVPVVVGFRYTSPMIGDVIKKLYADGVHTVVAVSLSPFESKSTDTAYSGAVDAVLPELPGLTVDYAPAFGSMPEFVELHREQLVFAFEATHCDAEKTLTLFTAHSLPLADLEVPERYVAGLRSVSGQIAAGLGLDSGVDFSASERLPGIASFGAPDARSAWLLAYQSKGQRPGEWLGPDIAEVMQIAATHGFEAVVVSPIGFATEHMETRYDLDIIEAQRAEKLGIRFARGQAPNDDSRLVAATSSAVIELLRSGA